jgi:hypothetical protein
MSPDVDFAALLARNARTLRGSAKLDDVARSCRHFGLNWNPSRVIELEQGKVSPTLPTLIAIALALGEVRGENLTLGDLLRSDENVTLTDDLTVTSGELQGFLDGGPVSVDEDRLMAEALQSARAALKLRGDWPARLRRVKHGLFVEVWRDYGEAEERLARDLGLDRDRLTAEMAALWGRSYHAERDRRAGPGVTAQKRGRVASVLKAQLQEVLDGDN